MKNAMDKVVKVEIDKDIVEFLKVAYFGYFSDEISAASSRAYRDMSRTIRFNNLLNEDRLLLREKVTTIFKDEILILRTSEISNQNEFDLWHKNLCNRIIETYRDQEIKLTYGQAQKWINMTIKYLYVLGYSSFENVFDYLHIPVDNYIFEIAMKQYGVIKPNVAWSKWDDYDCQYLTYKKAIKNKIKDISPLRWEFQNWVKAIKNI